MSIDVIADSSSDVKLHITDRDFTADFDGDSWTVNWRWKSNLLAILKNRVSCYNKNITGKKSEEFEKEVDRWIEEEILVPWNKVISLLIFCGISMIDVRLDG